MKLYRKDKDEFTELLNTGLLDINASQYEYGLFLLVAIDCHYDGEMIPFVDFLVNQLGADINANSLIEENHTCLHSIIEGAYEHCYDVAPAFKDFPRLKKPSVKMLEYFLSLAPNVNILDITGSTPLDLAIRYNIEEPMKILIEAGGKANKEQIPSHVTGI